MVGTSALPLDFAPGTQFAYSNTNYVVLGAIVERVSGLSYADFLRKRIFNGTPFSGISFGQPSGKIVSDGYDRDDPTKSLSIWSSNVSYAAGGLYATPTDLARWDDAFFGGRVVPAATVSQLTTPPELPYAKESTYAAGWVTSKIDGHSEILHNGGIPGFSTSNAYFPEQHLAIVVFGNTITFDPSFYHARYFSDHRAADGGANCRRLDLCTGRRRRDHRSCAPTVDALSERQDRPQPVFSSDVGCADRPQRCANERISYPRGRADEVHICEQNHASARNGVRLPRCDAGGDHFDDDKHRCR